MLASEITLAIVPPHYTLGGSRGFFLYVGQRRTLGWIKVGSDHRTVIATFNRAPWQHVSIIDDPAELSPDWITAHANAILQPF